MHKSKHVFFFGDQTTESCIDKKHLFGGKGANLIEMSGLGIPVPPGFVITTEVCDLFFKNNEILPVDIEQEIEYNLEKLENRLNLKFGGSNTPLLVSARSGAMVSMPGMMDSILNIGINEKTIDAIVRNTNNPRFAWNTYRRFIQMYGDVVKKIPPDAFEDILLKFDDYASDQINGNYEINIVNEFAKIYREYTTTDFPSHPREQLLESIKAVFRSWHNDRAIEYRKRNNINNLMGTAVIVQSMVFGNLGNNSGTGVYFTRDPLTGRNEPYGDFLINAQGEDVVAGARNPEPLSFLKESTFEIYDQLIKIGEFLERHFKDMQDIEFTFERDKLYILQARSGKRSELSAKKIAADMVEEGIV